MLRDDKKKRTMREDGKVFEVRNTQVLPSYLSVLYELSICDPAKITETGHLKLFTLRPKSGSGAYFEGRWDGGNREKQERQDLDIDIFDVDDTIKRQFKKGTDGWECHHSTMLDDQRGCRYDVRISMPTRKVFEGTVNFTKLRKLQLEATFEAKASLGIRRLFRKTSEFLK